MEPKQILSMADNKMGKTTEVLREGLISIRTSRASPALVDNIKVEYQGQLLNLKELTTISVPDPRTILIQPWDKEVLSNIEKALLKSDLGLMPLNDGRTIKLNIPPLTEERRRELVKLVRKRVEEARVAIRHIRQQAMEEIRKAEKEKLISQDEGRRLIDRLEKLTGSHIDEVTRLGERKEAEVMEI